MPKKVLFLNKLKGDFLAAELINAFVNLAETAFANFVENLVLSDISTHLETNGLLIL
jgi:hypothetical protein